VLDTCATICALLLSTPSTPNTPVDSAGVVTRLGFETLDQLVMFPVRVNGSRVLTFVLDSGAMHSCIDSVTAATLGLHPLATDSSQGVGRGSVPRQHVAPVVFSLGGVSFPVEDPWVFDLRHVGLSRPIDGMLGADLLERFITRIDPIEHTLTLMEPAMFRPESTRAVVPLELDNHRLYLDMKLTLPGGVTEVHRVRVDTGSGDAVSDNLVRRSSERRRSVVGVGLGQSYEDFSGVFERVELGPYAIERCWGPSNDHPAVGMEILRRFTLTFDVPHRRLYLEPNRHLHDPVPAPAASR
jgi:hypothetical protein